MFGALAMLISTVIGAGVLGLPRVFYENGLFSIPLLAIILSAIYLLGLMILEMLDNEKKPIQLPALIASKIGEKWKKPVYFSLIFSMYGALTAYL
ncbi:MAG: hypothetical protein GOU99_00575, partial [Candidatus Altiarchaeota archaeon]|nr:hypothetical protein [Candidatus Altiarchaeota archaeon]